MPTVTVGQENNADIEIYYEDQNHQQDTEMLKEAYMGSAEVQSTSRDAAVGNVDMHLEVEIIPVSDVDRSKQFYERLGWRLDDDVAPLDGLRIVQFTPPGSAASVTFGQGITTAAPGSAGGGLIVSDIEAVCVIIRQDAGGWRIAHYQVSRLN